MFISERFLCVAMSSILNHVLFVFTLWDENFMWDISFKNLLDRLSSHFQDLNSLWGFSVIQVLHSKECY